MKVSPVQYFATWYFLFLLCFFPILTGDVNLCCSEHVCNVVVEQLVQVTKLGFTFLTLKCLFWSICSATLYLFIRRNGDV